MRPVLPWKKRDLVLYVALFSQSLFCEDSFVEVPILPEEDAYRILSNWLSAAGRTLSPLQESIVSKALQKCSLPIFIRVAFDEAIRWKSYSLPSETVLQETVRGQQ